MGAELIGKLLSGITSDLAHSIGTREGAAPKGETTVQMAIIVIRDRCSLGDHEKGRRWVYLEFHTMDVDERRCR